MRTVQVGGLAVLMGVLVYPFCLWADEAAAVAWVEKQGGTIKRDEKSPDRPRRESRFVEVQGYGRWAQGTCALQVSAYAFPGRNTPQLAGD